MEKGKNVIQFPLKATPNPNIKIDDSALQMQQDIVFAEHLTEGLVVNMIHNMSENGIDTEDQSFIADISLMIELVKSTIYRSCEIPHPLQEIVDSFVETTKLDGGKTSVFLDTALMRDILTDDGEEEDDWVDDFGDMEELNKEVSPVFEKGYPSHEAVNKDTEE